MPKQRTRIRWEHPTYKYAYCIERRGTVYTIIDGGEKVAIRGLRWDAKNRSEAIRILDERLREAHKEKEPKETEVITDSKPKTLYEAIEEFSSVKFQKFDKATVKSYITAFRAYLIEDMKLEDVNRIRTMVRERQGINNHAPNTQLKYLSKLNKLFEYCIGQEYMNRNPILSGMKPDEVTLDIKLFTQEEIELLFDYFFKMDNVFVPAKGEKKERIRKRSLSEDKKQFAWMIKFISIAGTRAMETINIWWDVPNAPVMTYSTKKSIILLPDKIIIDGKRSKKAKPRDRELPLLIIPQIYPVLEELEKYKEINKGKLFKWNSVACLELWLRDALKELKLDGDRNLHELRKTATNWWEKELGIPLHVCNYMAGHNQQTRDKYYGSIPTAQELIKMSGVRIVSDSNENQFSRMPQYAILKNATKFVTSSLSMISNN